MYFLISRASLWLLACCWYYDSLYLVPVGILYVSLDWVQRFSVAKLEIVLVLGWGGDVLTLVLYLDLNIEFLRVQGFVFVEGGAVLL